MNILQYLREWKSKRLQRRILNNQTGSSAVEFAMVLLPLSLLMFGMVDFGRMLWSQEVLTNAVREGARQATLFQNTNGQGDIQTIVDEYLVAGGVDSTGLDVQLNPTQVAPGPPPVTAINVSATLPWNYLVIGGLVSAGGLNKSQLTASAVMRQE